MSKNKLMKHYRLISFLCGWLAVLSMPPFFQTWSLFISFSTLLWIISLSDKAQKAFKGGYYFGFSFFAFGLFWINNALLLDSSTFWLIPITFLATGLFFGLFIAIPSWICFYLKNNVSRYFSFASLIVIFEWFRSFFLTGFPWNLFGTSLVFSDSLIQTASIGGTYLLSLLLILSTATPFLIITSTSKYRLGYMIIPFAIFSTMYIYGNIRLNKYPYHPSDILIRIVQPSIPQNIKWSPASLEQNLNTHIKMSQIPSNKKIDFIIWSETAFPFSIEYDDYHRSLLTYAIPPNSKLITGGIRYQKKQYNQYNIYNSMFIVDSNQNIIGYYDKSHLVPFGEYIPLRKYLPQWLQPIASHIGNFSAGINKKPLSINNYPTLGGIICYEVIFPHQITDKINRPQWLVNLTNDGWYGDSAGPRQHFAATRLRAVEEGITIARAAGSGISALISPTGTVIKKLSLNQIDNLDVFLPSNISFSTIYSHYGNNITLVLSLIFLIGGLLFELAKKSIKVSKTK